MSGFNFADRYKAAGLNPPAETVTRREEAFAKLSENLNPQKVVDLTRLYFELPSEADIEWFRAGFADNDHSFSLVDNARESGVLASCLLSSALEDNDAIAGVAILSASACGARKPISYPALIADAKERLVSDSSNDRRVARTREWKIKLSKNNGAAAPDEVLAAEDWSKAGELVKTLVKNTASIATQAETLISTLAHDFVVLREEADMLWWYVGGWSKCLDRPFTELKPGAVAVVAGIDLASLTLTESGPSSFAAILHKVMLNSSKKSAGKISIQSAVDDLPTTDYVDLGLPDVLGGFANVCPILTAFRKANEIGSSPNWHEAYQKACGIKPSSTFSPLDLAVQAYREFLLLRNFEE